MPGEPIELSRAEVRELWDFMEEVKGTMAQTRLALADHEARLRDVEKEITSQRSERAFTRWVLPIGISIGALAVSLWALVKRTNGG